jgi:uncharacterized protein YgiM (DUF1202 family)
MLRLTLLLCAGLFAALMIAGEDRGQMRPGLALAAAEGRAPKVREPAVMAPAADAAPALAQTPALASPAPAPVVAPLPVAVASAAPQAEAYVEPARAVVQEVKEPIFTLSALGNELVPGQAEVGAGTVAQTAATEAPLASDDGSGTIWYVTANSVNVRAEPTTEAEVLGKLTNGEAALLVSTVDGDWARIVIQGDGMEGYVALRYLTPAAP